MTTAWFDNDTLWETLAPFMFTQERQSDGARRDVEQALALAKCAPGAAILDLGCGPGRHALELARRGFAVTGVDRTRAYLKQAEQQAATEKLPLELVHMDMRHFQRPGAFDAAFSMFTSFGYFENDDEDLTILRHVWEALRPTGRLVLDVLGKEVLARLFQARTWQPHPQGGAFLLEERVVRAGWQYVDSRWILLDAVGTREFRFSIRLYSGTELTALLHRAGFSSVHLFGTLLGQPYDQDAQRLVAVAQK